MLDGDEIFTDWREYLELVKRWGEQDESSTPKQNIDQ